MHPIHSRIAQGFFYVPLYAAKFSQSGNFPPNIVLLTTFLAILMNTVLIYSDLFLLRKLLW